ncbi:hypothetical protein NST62_02205 [Ureibacillus sp. FSL K6-8385]|uniref:Uncharacterized protein n=1 Tax=Ureibacillus terrenus TaxID=118246 RepID=A0A540V3Y5_9BACL|nr:hypothetical protein [Ureibacillus terrenus]MED3660955.1 hypothetical protein [Ureibacillus terrenus]MED3764927.1 hypothetical protein [Ureibacillus terrenus]TQE91449.1 hypothetical protein FKZ59_05590 [Ureibacillus terrenus]
MYQYFEDYAVVGLIGGFFVLIALILIHYILTAIIYYYTAKTNGPTDLAFLAWIPIINYYLLFAFGSKKTEPAEVKKDALIWAVIYAILVVVSLIPIIGWLAYIAVLIISIYYSYRLFYRWTGETGKSVLFVILTIITASIFFYIYGLIKMKKEFAAA